MWNRPRGTVTAWPEIRGESVLAVAYFAALLARSADRWTARDADLDQIEDVAGLVEFMREVPEDDEDEEEPDTSVLLLEQEDVWFAVIRLDADEDPRLFVSDMAAVSRSAYADLLLSSDLLPVGPDGRPAQQPVAAAGSAADDPDVLDAGETGSAVDDDGADPIISVMSHEHNETMSDPLGTAWYDGSGYENGDECAWLDLATQFNGIGDYSQRDIERILETGDMPDGDSVGGLMAAVVANTSKLSADDRSAIALYIKSLPPVQGPKRP